MNPQYKFFSEAKPLVSSARSKLEMMGDLDGAMEKVNEAVKLDPHCAEAYDVRARIKFKRGDLEGARSDLEKAIEQCPNPWTYFRLAIVEYKLGNEGQAIHYLQEAIGWKPDFSEAYALLGKIQLEQGKVEETKRLLEKPLGDYSRFF